MPDLLNETLIDETDLSIGDQIALNKELIRVLEKEIDDATASNTKQGFTIWTLIGGIAGAAFIFFGQTKDIGSIPETSSQVFVTFLLLFQFLIGLFSLATGESVFTKKGRLVDVRQAFRGRFFSISIRFISLIVASTFIATLTIPTWVMIVTILLPLLPSLYFVMSFIILRKTNRPIGNNPQFPRVPIIWGIIFLSCYLFPVILLGNSLPFPIGQPLTTAYILGLCGAAIIVMFEVIVAISTSVSHVRDLRELRDDIIFRRIELNDALNRFKIIKEGKSVFDQVKPNFDQLMSYLAREEEIADDQLRIIRRILVLTSHDGAKVQSAESIEQVSILTNSFVNYNRELNGLIAVVNRELPVFNDMLNKAAAASGDYSSSSSLSAELSGRLAELVKKQQDVNEARGMLIAQAESDKPSELIN